MIKDAKFASLQLSLQESLQTCKTGLTLQELSLHYYSLCKLANFRFHGLFGRVKNGSFHFVCKTLTRDTPPCLGRRGPRTLAVNAPAMRRCNGG